MDAPAEAGRSTEPIRLTTHHRWRRILTALVVIPVLGFTLYSGLALRWDYSSGMRAGVLQKFSRKGWLCKTWEGELAMTTVPGVAPTLWEFSVRDADVAARVNALVGRRVTLHYTEHRGVPTTCFGDTQYYADSVAAVP
jgi:hypothetical protein